MDAQLQHIVEQVRSAAAGNSPLRIRGGGSKDFYWPGGAPEGQTQGQTQGNPQLGQVLDTTALNGIVSYEPSELVVTVKAGTPLAELEAVLAGKNQCLPFEPPHFGEAQATVGGMVAAGLSGPARASVGGVRDYVLGLELLNGRAELLRFGGTVMKNVAGYDVSRLMVGAMGTLGVITEVSLKVLPLAPAEASLVFDKDQASALKQLNTWGGQPLPLNASRWQALQASESAGMGQLHVRLRGAAAAVKSASQWMVQNAGARPLDVQEAAVQWRLCRDLKLPFFTEPPAADQVLWRASVAQTTPVLGLPCAPLIEWHGSLRWFWENPFKNDIKKIMSENMINNATIFISNNTNYLTALREKINDKNKSTTNMQIQQRLKAEFDPAGIFNQGRLHPDF